MIILFSIAFSIFSLIEYLKYKNPNVIYSKNNDKETERIFYLKDFLLVFQLMDMMTYNTIDNSTGYYQGYYGTLFINGTIQISPLAIERCELGKNINNTYKDLVSDNTYGRKLEDFYCISSQYQNLSLFYDPNVGSSSIVLEVVIKNTSIYTPEKIQSVIATENNLIDHYSKDNPLKKSFIYQLTTVYSSLEYTMIDYNLQFIKYESDEGLFYNKYKFSKGMSFSDMTSYRVNMEDYDLEKDLQESNYSVIGEIEFKINQSYFDSYKRTYQKLQSLLAEVMSVVSLLFEIGRQISNILCDKKMSKDIAEYLLNQNIGNSISFQNHKINNLFINNDKRETKISERKNLKLELKDKMNNINVIEKNDENELNKSELKNIISKNEKINKKNETIRIIKQINYFHILKSFLCFKDKKTRLINQYHNIITEDMSIEKILESFYKLENISNYFSDKENKNLLSKKKKEIESSKKAN